MKTVLCPVNFIGASRTALRTAAEIAIRFGARLVPVCVLEEDRATAGSNITERIQEWVREIAPAPCPMEIEVRRGHAAEQILSVISQVRADMVVLGVPHHDAPASWPFGNTTELVLRRSASPVLVVPGKA